MFSPARWVLPVLLVVVPTVASAQEAGDVGIAMGYPTAAGLIGHLSDRLAVRPDVTFAWTSTDSDVILDRTSTTVGLGVSALVYLSHVDALRTYVSPRFAWSHNSSDNSVSNFASDTYSVSGSFGAQYRLSDRFGVYGEIGIQYSHSASDTIIISSATTHSWGTRSGVGAILYF